MREAIYKSFTSTTEGTEQTQTRGTSVTEVIQPEVHWYLRADYQPRETTSTTKK